MTPEGTASSEGIRSSHRRNRRERGRRRATLIIAGVVVVSLLVGGGLALWSFLRPAKDYTGAGTGQVTVTIPDGASLTRIGSILADAGVVGSTSAFVDAAQADDRSGSIGPGTYTMAAQMSGAAAVNRLLDPSARVTQRVVVREGATVREITDEIVAKTSITRQHVDAALAQPATLGLPGYAKGRVEGFLFPATYDVDPKDTATTLLQAMVTRFNQVSVEIGFERRAIAAGLKPYDAVIIASLAQAEVSPQDYAKVARVIDNRLSKGMMLQFDSTVKYAVGGTSGKLTTADFAVDSPFNTFKVKGLPPTPINSPSKEALQAAVSPAAGPWLYFVTTDPSTGTTKFTDSYSEFLKFTAEFQANTP